MFKSFQRISVEYIQNIRDKILIKCATKFYRFINEKNIIQIYAHTHTHLHLHNECDQASRKDD